MKIEKLYAYLGTDMHVYEIGKPAEAEKGTNPPLITDIKEYCHPFPQYTYHSITFDDGVKLKISTPIFIQHSSGGEYDK